MVFGFLANTIDLRTGQSGAARCIMFSVMFPYIAVRRRGQQFDFEESREVTFSQHARSGSVFQLVVSCQTTSLHFIPPLFPAQPVPWHLSPRPRLVVLQPAEGCGCDALFPPPAFPLSSWFSTVPWLFCH